MDLSTSDSIEQLRAENQRLRARVAALEARPGPDMPAAAAPAGPPDQDAAAHAARLDSLLPAGG